jgi:predicted permease
MVLLAASGAAVRELLTLYHSSLGYDPSHVLLATATLPEGSHQDWRERSQFIDRLQQQIASTPQVQAVGLGVYIQPPPRIGGARTLIEIPGQTVSRDLLPILQQVSSGYFGSLSIPVEQGRIWSRSEGLQAAHVAVINETMARRLWPGGDAIGRRVRIPQLGRTSSQFVLAAPGADGWVDIVGIVGDTPNVGLREPPAPVIYVPHTLMLGDIITFAIRTSVDPLSLERSVREQVRSVDPNQALTQVRTAERALVDAGWARERFVVALTAAFGAFALLLAVVGLFSVVSFAVSSRVREFGVRMALGARAASVMRLALLRPFIAAMIGVVVGAMLSVAINRGIARWSVGNLGNPMMLTVVAAVLGAAALAAAVGPALRAMRIQPSSALRTE